MNLGGLRADLDVGPDLVATFGQAQVVLQFSSGLRYQWDAARPAGAKVVPGSIRIDGAPLEDTKTYRVVANNFLAEGADGFLMFAQATNKHDTGIVDLDAFIGLLVKRSSAAPAAAVTAPRIERLN